MSPLTTTTTGEELTGDARQVALLIEWAHAHGVEMSAVAIGGCTVTLMPRRGAASQVGPERKTGNIYGDFGGERYQTLVEKPESGDDDYVPVVGRR